MADLTNGLLQGLQQGLGSYLEASERRKDRELRQKEMEDASGFRKQSLEADFYKAGLLPKYDPSGKLIGADVNEPVMKAKRDADPMTGLLQSYQLEKVKKESEQMEKGTKLPPDKVLLVQQGAQIPKQLKDIENTLEANKGSFGPIVGNLGSLNPYAEKAQTIDAQVRASAQAFGRYMEGGVLRKEDEEKYRKMFPSLSDPPDIAKNKLAIVNKMLVDKQNADVGALKNQGYDVSGFSQLEPAQLPSVLGPQQSQAKTVSPQDQKALDWARKNPQDPRAKAIMQKLGM